MARAAGRGRRGPAKRVRNARHGPRRAERNASLAANNTRKTGGRRRGDFAIFDASVQPMYPAARRSPGPLPAMSLPEVRHRRSARSGNVCGICRRLLFPGGGSACCPVAGLPLPCASGAGARGCASGCTGGVLSLFSGDALSWAGEASAASGTAIGGASDEGVGETLGVGVAGAPGVADWGGADGGAGSVGWRLSQAAISSSERNIGTNTGTAGAIRPGRGRRGVKAVGVRFMGKAPLMAGVAGNPGLCRKDGFKSSGIFHAHSAGTSLAGVRQGTERGKQAENARHGDGVAPSAGRHHHVLERRRGDVRHSLLSKRAWLQRYGWQPVLIARRCRAARHASGRFLSHQSRRAGGPGCGSARRHGAAGSVRGSKMARLQSPDASTFGERCAAVSGERVSLRKILPISWCGAPGS